MTFELLCPTDLSSDLPQLESLYGLAPMAGQSGLGIAPIVVGGVAAASAIAAWLSDDDWSIGEYNAMVRKIDDLIHEVDQLGWTGDCWKKHPAKRRAFKRFWAQWSKHFGEYGVIGECFDFDKKYTCFVPDSAERPIRNIFLPELKGWIAWVEKTCDVQAGSPTPIRDPEEDKTSDINIGVGLGATGALIAVGLGVGALLLIARR